MFSFVQKVLSFFFLYLLYLLMNCVSGIFFGSDFFPTKNPIFLGEGPLKFDFLPTRSLMHVYD